MATTTPTGVQGTGFGGGAKHASPAHAHAPGQHGQHGQHGHAASAPAGTAENAPMSHRQIMEALSGLLLGMFVAILSSTIVSNALPRIVSDLGGGQSSYTWVVTASLLTMTASTPLWGKMADLVSKKVLVQTAIVIFVLASASAGFAQNPGMLITSRAVQGIGMGGISALAQIVIAAMISPRERGRYTGYIGASFAVAMVSGPLLGGVITDTSWLGWRWCFYVGIPFAVIALLVLQKTLHLPVIKRDVKVDWGGALLVAAAASLLLIWVTFAGNKYDWLSWQTYTMVGGSIVLALLFLLVESKASEPIIPLRLFRNSTISLAAAGSLFVGIGMFAGTVYLSQYFQLARGESPTKAGVLTIPMILGMFLSTTFSGQIISRTGKWKVWLVSGGVLLTAALGLMSTVRYDTPYWHVAVFMAGLGVGVGMMMQNLVLATQNQVDARDLGSASSTVNFFRSLGGAVGVSVLGAVLATRITDYASDGLRKLGVGGQGGMSGGGGSGIPNLAKLPAPIREVIESAYGHGIGDIYLFAAPGALLALILVVFIKEVPLRTKNALDAADEATGATPPAGAEGAAVSSGTLAADAPSGQAPALVGAGAAHGAGGAGIGVGGMGTNTGANRNTGTGMSMGMSGVGAQGNGRPQPSWAMTQEQGQGPGQDAYALQGQAQQAYGQNGGPVGGLPYDGAEQDQSGYSAYGIRGTVRNADGVGVARAAVTLISLSGRQLGRAVAHGDGSYGLDAPGPGSYVLIAAADGHQPQASSVVVGEEPLGHDILLSGTSGLAGNVRSATDGLPVPGAMVVIADVRGEVLATCRTGVRGEFTFDELVTGSFTVAVSAPGFRPVARPVDVGGQGVTRIDVEMHAGARLQGVVRAGAAQAPLADARVTLVDAAGNVVATSTTGEDGAYAFTDLDAGDYSVIASGYPPVANALKIDGSGVDGYDIELHHPDE